MTIRLLRWLCDDPRAVVLESFPIDLDDDQKQDKAVFRKAMTAVRRTWKSIGFEPFSALEQLSGHNYALDLVGALVDLGVVGSGCL